MRHERFLIAGAAVALMAAACDNGSSITSPEAAYPTPAFDALGSHTVTQDFPWAVVELNPCNNDMVTISGSTHIVSGEQFDNSGGMHLSVSFSSRGSGVGLPPAMLAYTVSEQTTDSQQDPEGDQSSQLLEQRLLVRAPKPSLNYLRHTVFKLTRNAAGVPTATFERSFTKCGGETILEVDI